MKKFISIVFAALLAVTLSAPAWAQTTSGTQGKPASVTKQEKKDTKAKAKAAKKASKKSNSKKSDNAKK